MYFEDYKIGQIFDQEIESLSFSECELIEYAKKYDPRPIHIDKEAERKSRFGKIIASGSFANMAFWAQWVKTGIDAGGVVAGVSVNNAEWLKPIYPDILYDIKVEIVDKRVRRKGKDGFVSQKMMVYNPKGELCLTYTASALVNFKNIIDN
jgi:maoC domain protein dehydratase